MYAFIFIIVTLYTFNVSAIFLFLQSISFFLFSPREIFSFCIDCMFFTCLL